MKPNIFDIATKELSQDAFITWFLQWADPQNVEFDRNLNLCASDFLIKLIKKEFPNFDEKIETVKAGRHWENVDVWAEVNNKYLIIIEDKIFTGQHSGQLSKYRTIAEDWCNEQIPKYNSPICIYLKTGNESQQSLDFVIKEGFKLFNRQELINLIEKHNTITNDIFNDFLTRLIKLEKINNEWEKKIIDQWNGNDWQGFFQYLEKEINIVGWNYVNNPNGGFWNAVLNWDYWDETYPVYLQIEEFKLCFKISTDPEEVDLPENVSRGHIRNKVSELILNTAKTKGIDTIRRPDRFGSGKYMTAAIVYCENWLGSKNEIINKKKVADRLLYYKSFLLDVIK